MGRLARGVAWGAIFWCAFLAFWTRAAGLAWVPFAVLAVLCVVFLVLSGRRERRAGKSLPRGVKRLAYRSDETYVAFCWLWHRGQPRRMRVLRSDEHAAAAADEAEGQTCVYDGGDDRFVDDGVAPRRTYHYSLFVANAAAGWAEPVCQSVMTYSQADQVSLESQSPAPPLTREQANAAELMMALRRGPDCLLTDSVAGVATDLIFAAASVFAGDKAADGWQEIT